MRSIYRYLNPIVHLGESNYSFVFPLIANIVLCVSSEFYAYIIARNPLIIGEYIIFINVAFIIYFSFRDGLRGGYISTLFAICYYFYIIATRHYHGFELSMAVDTTIILGVLYAILASIIGWLKQRIDWLIESSAIEKERLQTIIDQLPVGVIVTDGHGILTQTNKQLNKILGIRMPIGFAIGLDTIPQIKINGSLPIPHQSPLSQALKKGTSIIGREIYYQQVNGNEGKYLQVNSAPIHNKKRRVIAAASIITDITGQKDLERQKDDFLSMASHELKTPLTSLKMFLDLQEKELSSSKSKKAQYFNQRIKDQIHRLSELTNDLLDISRIQTGKLRFKKESFQLSQIVSDTLEGLSGMTRQHELVLRNNFSGQVFADRYRIYQVLVNLISNAIKYSPKGRKIIITLSSQNRHALISVKDYGIGIEKEQQKKIFERLYQVTDRNEKTFPGLGLGLFIAKEIVERHSGKIWVTSEKGKGSTFSFSLPIPHKKG